MSEKSPESAYRELEDLLGEADRAGREYAAAWRNADTPRIEAFLPSADSLAYDFVLLSLISVDRRERGLRGRSDRLEEWLVRFPRSSELIQEHWNSISSSQSEVQNILNFPRSSSAHDIQTVGDILPDRPILERLAEGRTTTLYRATAPPEDPGAKGLSTQFASRHTVVKVLRKEFLAKFPPDDRDRWISQWQAANLEVAHANPPGLVGVLDALQREQLAYVRLELVEGGSAERLLRQSRDQVSAAKIILAAAAALQSAHAANLFHGGLRASKLLILPNGSVKIGGYGFVKAFERMPEAWKRCARGIRSFLAPELQSDPNALTPSCDIFSLGAILYQLLAGQPPFGDLDAEPELASFPSNQPIPLTRLNPTVDRSLAQIVSKCLSQTPSQRYKDLAMFHADLADTLEDLSNRTRWYPGKYLQQWWLTRRKK